MNTPAPRLLRRATLLLASLVVLSGAASAQSKGEPDALDLMREALREKRYADVIDRGNDLLGSSRSFTLAEQVMLWQVMAAAYYPPDVMAQRPDSARLPLDALVRLAPDATLTADLRWPGLDSLLERSRDATFAVVARPQPEYAISAAEPAYLTVVASRPARFRLTSISSATGVATVHDSSGVGRSASLRLRGHDGVRPVFGSGDYLLQVTAIDVRSGDSVVVTRRALARANGSGAGPAIPPFIPPASVRVPAMKRGTLLLGGLAFAGATVALASGARAEEPIRSGFDTDNRAMIVGGAMVAAAVTGFLIDRGRSRPPDEADIARARAAYDRRVSALMAESAERAGRYRVTLTVDSRDR